MPVRTRECSDIESLTLKIWDIGQAAHINDTVTTGLHIFAALVIPNQEFRHFILSLLQSPRLLILVHLLPETELLSSALPWWRWSGHVSRIWWIVARRFKDKLEDASVMLSPGVGSHQDLDWRWYRGDNNYTNINQGEDYDGIHFGPFSVGSNQNHIPALDNLLEVTQGYFG